jgi:heme peroxidase
VHRHAQEEYHLVGEGILGQDAEGAACRRRPSTVEQERRFQFSRLGPKGGADLDDAVLEAVARAMTAPSVQHPDADGVPAGYTYLGQFVDHDLTKDVTGRALGTELTVESLLQGRSPTLDLDSLYGRGPWHLHDREYYSGDAHLRMGVAAATGVPPADPAVQSDHPGFDLPRVGIDPTRPQTAADRRAPLIPDARNDENLAVAQTHLAFIRFHNRVVDTLAEDGVAGADQFEQARRIVVRHYQWMLRTDYLPRIVDPAVVDDVFTHGRRFFEADAPYPASRPTMPIEFSVAAFRLGHSQVRSSYEWNRVFRTGGFGPATMLQLFAFSGVSGALDNLPLDQLDDPNASPTALRLPSTWIADFGQLFDFAEAQRPELTPEAGPNLAKRIDTGLVDPLAHLPAGSFGGRPPAAAAAMQRNLAFRNLRRATMVDLASGQQLAQLFGSEPLTREQVLAGTGNVVVSGLAPEQEDELAARTPLWFYVLREAELNGGRMAGVGARIVAEVFHRAMEGSRVSIVRDADWRPALGPDADTFRMVDLLLYAAQGDAAVINPLGPTSPAPATPTPRSAGDEPVVLSAMA